MAEDTKERVSLSQPLPVKTLDKKSRQLVDLTLPTPGLFKKNFSISLDRRKIEGRFIHGEIAAGTVFSITTIGKNEKTGGKDILYFASVADSGSTEKILDLEPISEKELDGYTDTIYKLSPLLSKDSGRNLAKARVIHESELDKGGQHLTVQSETRVTFTPQSDSAGFSRMRGK